MKKGDEEALKKAQDQSQVSTPHMELNGEIPITASVPGRSVEEDEEGKLSGEELQKLSEALKSMTKESALEDVKVFLLSNKNTHKIGKIGRFKRRS